MHTTRVKIYPDGSTEIMVCDRAVFRPDGWEVRVDTLPPPSPEGAQERKKTPESDNVQRAMRRARAQVRDIALCTPFSYFVTLTLSKEMVDRYDVQAVTRKLNVWLDNAVRRKGLAYVLVPERHKDGALHFHGFFNSALPVVDSGHTDKDGHTVYNLPAWTLGFTTAIALYGDYAQAVSYVCKYIGKQGDKIGGRWYYSGGALSVPTVEYTNFITIRDMGDHPRAYRFDVKEAGLSFAMVRLAAGETLTVGGEQCSLCEPKTG